MIIPNHPWKSVVSLIKTFKTSTWKFTSWNSTFNLVNTPVPLSITSSQPFFYSDVVVVIVVSSVSLLSWLQIVVIRRCHFSPWRVHRLILCWLIVPLDCPSPGIWRACNFSFSPLVPFIVVYVLMVWLWFKWGSVKAFYEHLRVFLINSLH